MTEDAVVNIYGGIAEESDMILAVGNYNNVHGVLSHHPRGSLVEMVRFPEVDPDSVVKIKAIREVITGNRRALFSLLVEGSKNKSRQLYINIKIESENGEKIAVARLSTSKALFWLEYSSVDNFPRKEILAGSLVSLATSFGEKDYIVSWKIRDFANGDLVMFLPTSWYETRNMEECVKTEGVGDLISSLEQISFRGYTSHELCTDFQEIRYCTQGERCMECLGRCADQSDLCTPSISTPGYFVCSSDSGGQGILSKENNNIIWVVVVVSLLALFFLLVWGVALKYGS